MEAHQEIAVPGQLEDQVGTGDNVGHIAGHRLYLKQSRPALQVQQDHNDEKDQGPLKDQHKDVLSCLVRQLVQESPIEHLGLVSEFGRRTLVTFLMPSSLERGTLLDHTSIGKHVVLGGGMVSWSVYLLQGVI